MYDIFGKLEDDSDNDARGGGDNGEAGPSGLSLKENQQPSLHKQAGPSNGAKATRPGLIDTSGQCRAEERHAAHSLLWVRLPCCHAGHPC